MSLFSHGSSIESRLIEACRSVQGMTRAGDNGEYKYLRILDIANALRNELFSRGLLLIPNDLEQKSQSFQLAQADRWLTEVTVKTEFVITDGHRRKRYSAFGTGRDMDGKALAIAQTAALKSFLKRMGLIFGEKDDPEIIEAPIRGQDEGLTPHQAMRQGQFQQRAWAAALTNCGKTAAQVEAFLSSAFAFRVTSDDIASLSPKDFDIAVKWLTTNGDLGQTLELSKQLAEARKGPQPITSVLDHQPKDEMTGD